MKEPTKAQTDTCPLNGVNQSLHKNERWNGFIAAMIDLDVRVAFYKQFHWVTPWYWCWSMHRRKIDELTCQHQRKKNGAGMIFIKSSVFHIRYTRYVHNETFASVRLCRLGFAYNIGYFTSSSAQSFISIVVRWIGYVVQWAHKSWLHRYRRSIDAVYNV